MSRSYTSGQLSFGLKTPQEIVAKLRRELDRFRSATKAEDRTDHAINFAVTAWSMPDWFVERRLPTASPQEREQALRRIQSEMLAKCPELKSMKDIANESKHAKISKYTPSTIGAYTSSASIPPGVSPGTLYNGTAVVPSSQCNIYGESVQEESQEMVVHNVVSDRGKTTFLAQGEAVLKFFTNCEV